MKKIIEFIKQQQVKLLILLVLIFFFRSCGGSHDLRTLENKHKNDLVEIKEKHDVEKIKSYKEGQVNSFNTVIDDLSKINIPPVLMELHNKWINDRDEINKDIK